MLPFAGGLTGTANGSLVFAVAAALLYAAMLPRPPGWRRSLVKTASTALLAVMALSVGGPLLLIVALLLCAAGDFFLSRDGEGAFLAGLASFLAGHVAYVALFSLHRAAQPALPGMVVQAIMILLTAMLALVMTRLLLAAAPARLRAPIVAYIAAIAAMGAAAALFQPAPVLLGAVLFMASDTMLATSLFLLPAAHRHQPPLRLGVWTTYFAAQCLIALGLLI